MEKENYSTGNNASGPSGKKRCQAYFWIRFEDIVQTNNTTQHNTTQHNTTQHNTTQHNTTQHNTTQHNTTQHAPWSEGLQSLLSQLHHCIKSHQWPA